MITKAQWRSDWFKAIMASKGLRPKKAAALMGVNRTTVVLMGASKKGPTAETLARALIVLGCTVRDLFEITEQPDEAVDEKSPERPAEAQAQQSVISQEIDSLDLEEPSGVEDGELDIEDELEEEGTSFE